MFHIRVNERTHIRTKKKFRLDSLLSPLLAIKFMAWLISGWHVRGVEKQKEDIEKREREYVKTLTYPLFLFLKFKQLLCKA